MKTISLICTALLGFGALSTVSAETLTLDSAIERLKAQNLEIRAAEYDEQSAAKKVSQAWGKHWGSLDFIQNVVNSNDALNVFGFKLTSREATFGDFGFAQFDSTNPNILSVAPEDLNYPGSRNFFQSMLQYSLPLYAGGKISAYVDAAENMEKLKQLDKAKVLNEKIFETRKAYYDMRLLDEALANLKTILHNVDTLEAMTQSMMKEGYATKTDLLEVQAKKSNVERNIHEMEANEALLYHYLSFLLNEKVTAITLPPTDVPMPKLEARQIIENNIDVRRAQTGLEIHKNMEDAAFANYLPTIGVQANVQTAADSFQHYAADKGSYTVGVQLKWNLFDGGSDYADDQRARIETLKNKTQIELAKKGIALQVDKIHTQIKSLDYEIDALSKELALANEIYASYEERYREQLASMSDVVIKQSQQLEKILALLKVKNQRTEKIFALEKLANGVTQ